MTTLSPTLPTNTLRPRDVQVADIAPHTQVLRSRTWERLKFEVEYGRRQGTTANAYLIHSDRTALLDPPGESFTAIFLAELQQQLDLKTLDFIILGHVNSNRMATLAILVELAPQATIICSHPAANTLKATFPNWESRLLAVRSDVQIDLGQGHRLKFLTVPTPRWPDGLCTYDPATQILYTDKFLGAHVCSAALWDQDWRQLEADRRYYFDGLHAPQAKQVADALDQFATLPATCYAPAHGPVVHYSLSRLLADYRQWCQQQTTQDVRVALLYASAYGNTATIASAIAQGLIQAQAAVELVNCELANPDDLARVIAACDGFIIGSPTLGGHAPVQIQTALGIILATAPTTKLAGVFGSYGWSGEAIDLIETKLRDANFSFGFDPIRVRFSPTAMTLQLCEDAGAEFAQQVRRRKKQRPTRSGATVAQTADRTAQAMGRVIGSLCVLTTQVGDHHRGMLMAWVSQATFNPPGIMVAIAADQAEPLLRPQAPLVLNLLQEGRAVRRHFSHQPTPGANPFGELAHHASTNGCLILDAALAYLECRVESWMEVGDHWLVYAIVQQGAVLKLEGMTAIRHRQSGSHY
ncbi:diflavin flavoprotein [Trichothermofontia sp.]